MGAAQQQAKGSRELNDRIQKLARCRKGIELVAVMVTKL
jgi:hypothetical protein